MNFQTLRLILLFLGQISLPSVIDLFLSLFGYKASSEENGIAQEKKQNNTTGKILLGGFIFSSVSLAILAAGATGSYFLIRHHAQQDMRNDAKEVFVTNPETGKLEKWLVIEQEEVEHFQPK